MPALQIELLAKLGWGGPAWHRLLCGHRQMWGLAAAKGVYHSFT